MKKGIIIPVLLIALSIFVSCAGKEEAQTAKGKITVGSGQCNRDYARKGKF
jgi:hypothetical protein